MIEYSWPESTPQPRQSALPKVIRRRYLIDRKRQLRTVVMTTSLVATLVLLVNLGFAFLRTSQTSFLAAVAPQLTPVIDRQDDVFWLIMLVMSVLLVVAVALKTIVDTHHTAGAVFAVRQRLERVTDGDLGVVLKLRRGDNLQDLEKPFNDMVSSLRSRALVESGTLDDLAMKAGNLGADGEELARALHGLAQFKRQLGT
jgi:methyl-accepting chemotaxis protein